MPLCARVGSGRQTQENCVYDENMSAGYIRGEGRFAGCFVLGSKTKLSFSLKFGTCYPCAWYPCTVWVTKKFPFFETRYRAMVILRSVFVSVLFYNFPCFYCCVSILKVRRKEQLKNGKKNGAKNGVKTATQCVFSPPLFCNYCTSLLVPR